jgi:Na+-driven multidrug efflux pump
MISAAFGTSLFVEGSHGESLKRNSLKTTFATFIVLIPIAAILYLFGGYILELIGPNYINGFSLLKTIIVSSFFYAICMIYFSISRVQKNVKDLILIGFTIFILLIGLSYILMTKYGIVGVGFAWIISYFVGSIIVITRIWKLK